jgi:hypothetical protein
MPYRKWALADYAGATLWITTYISIGYALGIAGLSLDSTDEWFRYVEWALLAIVFLWMFIILRKHGKAIFGALEGKDTEETEAATGANAEASENRESELEQEPVETPGQH